MFIPFHGKSPEVGDSVFVADGAKIVGDVTIETDSSVWFNAVLRGDLAPIRIGQRTNIQDGAVGHVNRGEGLIIGDDVSVGHGAIIHACTIGSGTLVGMGSIVMSKAIVGRGVLIGAGALVTEGTQIPDFSLCFGSPAKVIRRLEPLEMKELQETAARYAAKAKEFQQELNNG